MTRSYGPMLLRRGQLVPAPLKARRPEVSPYADALREFLQENE